MDSRAAVRNLGGLVARKLADATEEVSKAKAGKVISKHRVLDLFAASGSLQRGSAAFAGALSDYVNQRALLGDGTDGIAEYELISSTDFYAQAIDTFVCVVDGLDPRDVVGQPHRDSAVYLETDGGTTNRLSHAVHFGTRDLDSYRGLLEETKQQDETLRGAVQDLRNRISSAFDFTHLFD